MCKICKNINHLKFRENLSIFWVNLNKILRICYKILKKFGVNFSVKFVKIWGKRYRDSQEGDILDSSVKIIRKI